MNTEDVTFDNFLSLDPSEREKFLKDPEKMKKLVRKNLGAHRYAHSLSVADTCKDLAKAHHYDEDKAYMAGLLHDCCKFKDEKGKSLLRSLLEKYDPQKLSYPEPTYHSFAAKYYLKEKCDFKDQEILNAIYNHTICDSDDTLSIILYIADKREPLRQIDDDILAIAHEDLYKAYDLLKADVEKYIRGNNEGFIENRV